MKLKKILVHARNVLSDIYLEFRLLELREIKRASFAKLGLKKRETKELAVIHHWLIKYYDQIYYDYKQEKSRINDSEQPKGPKIYSFWHSGHETSPELIKWCASELQESSRDVMFLNQNNLSRLHELNLDYFKYIRKWYNRIDILRFELLAKYGGIYIDADLWCRENAQFYYEQLIERNSSFFAFSEPNNFNIRIGFLAGKKGNYISTFLYVALKKLWETENRFFLERVSFHHVRWLFISLCLYDEKFKRSWERSLTRNVLPNYMLIRNIRKHGNTGSVLRDVSKTDIHILSHKRKDIDIGKLTSWGNKYIATNLRECFSVEEFNREEN